MKPLIVLITVFIVSLFATKIFRNQYDMGLSGRMAMSGMLLFTAIGHFAFSNGMAMMIPDIIPAKRELVYLTGIFEICAAIALFIPNLKVLTGWLLIVFFLLVLPANIFAAIRHVDYQKGSFNGNGPVYLWFRVPIQILFIGWTYFFTIKR